MQDVSTCGIYGKCSSILSQKLMASSDFNLPGCIRLQAILLIEFGPQLSDP